MQPQNPNDHPAVTPLATPGSAPLGEGKLAISDQDMERAKGIISKIRTAFSSKVVGQDNLRQSLMVAMLTEGHVLMESVPGLAKTTAAHTLAQSLQASFKRIQCTPDLLPSDIVGTQIYDYAKGAFETQLGPVHANIVLLDEINRSSAKTQSAMLEAMQERQTSIGGHAYKLPQPFLVLATQNPIEQEGTYELPEAQLDRFLLKEVLVYPTPQEEKQILERLDEGVFDKGLDSGQIVSIEDMQFLQQLTKKVYVDEAIKDYIVTIINATRNISQVVSSDIARYVQFGASPRGSIALQQVARALALLQGRGYATPDDVKQLRYSVLRHRLILNFEAIADKVHPEVIIDAIFNAVTTP